MLEVSWFYTSMLDLDFWKGGLSVFRELVWWRACTQLQAAVTLQWLRGGCWIFAMSSFSLEGAGFTVHHPATAAFLWNSSLASPQLGWSDSSLWGCVHGEQILLYGWFFFFSFSSLPSKCFPGLIDESFLIWFHYSEDRDGKYNLMQQGWIFFFLAFCSVNRKNPFKSVC